MNYTNKTVLKVRGLLNHQQKFDQLYALSYDYGALADDPNGEVRENLYNKMFVILHEFNETYDHFVRVNLFDCLVIATMEGRLHD